MRFGDDRRESLKLLFAQLDTCFIPLAKAAYSAWIKPIRRCAWNYGRIRCVQKFELKSLLKHVDFNLTLVDATEKRFGRRMSRIGLSHAGRMLIDQTTHKLRIR